MLSGSISNDYFSLFEFEIFLKEHVSVLQLGEKENDPSLQSLPHIGN